MPVNPFILSPNERMADWKKFRSSLNSMDEMTQLQSVATYWAQAPLLKIAYDTSSHENWPSTWEMIQAGHWCRNSVAIGMEATMRLSGWDATRLRLKNVIDRTASEMGLVLSVDNKWLLNHEWGKIREMNSDISTIQEWQYGRKSYQQI